MSQVFISYAEEDGPLAEELASGLEGYGYTTWYYQRDCRVPGQRWWRRVLQAVDDSQVVILLISRASLQSAQVDREVDWGIAAGKPLIPVLHNVTRTEAMAVPAGREWLAAIGTAVDISSAEGVAAVQEKLAAGLSEINVLPLGSPGAVPTSVEEPVAGPAVAETTLVLPPGCRWYAEPPPDCPFSDAAAYALWVQAHGPVSITNEASGIELVWVPGGSFMMGSMRGREDERPVRRVRVEGFWLGRTPVTVRQWQLVTGYVPPQFNSQGAQHPVVGVTWDEAHEFCRRLGLALPPEQYWEYAARGSEGRVYPWGNTWDPKLCQSKEDLHGHPRTAPAAGLPDNASWCGALDMAGNVWEWSQDAYQPQPHGDGSPTPAGTPVRRSLRGGGYGCDAFECRSSCRLAAAPTNRSPMVGLRVARPKARPERSPSSNQP